MAKTNTKVPVSPAPPKQLEAFGFRWDPKKKKWFFTFKQGRMYNFDMHYSDKEFQKLTPEMLFARILSAGDRSAFDQGYERGVQTVRHGFAILLGMGFIPLKNDIDNPSWMDENGEIQYENFTTKPREGDSL